MGLVEFLSIAIMRCLRVSGCLLLVWMCALPARSQIFQFGFKTGVPLTGFFETVQSSGFFTFNSTTNPYIIGPEVEVNLPFGVGVEVDALYRHFHYATSGHFIEFSTSATGRGSSWEFPLLAKYRFSRRTVQPYIEGGVAWDTMTGLSETTTQGQTFPVRLLPTTTTTSHPSELHNRTVTGLVMGAGVDWHALFIHISPEIRVTLWTSQHFQGVAYALNPIYEVPLSKQNQAEFLVGFTF